MHLNKALLGRRKFFTRLYVQVQVRGGLDAHADSNDRHAGTNTLRKAAWNGRPEKWYVRALVCLTVIELLLGWLAFTGFGCR